MKLHISNDIDKDAKKHISDQLFLFNLQHFPDKYKGRYQELNLYLKDADGQVFGGMIGEICWNWLEIQYLFVEETFRKSGYGSKLMIEAERIAKEKKCDFIKVDTLSFQALDFYKKHGYEVYGVIENAGSHTHYYLKKDI